MPTLNEPHRKLKCLYAGYICIESKLGMRTMNQAIQTVLKNVHPNQWLPVYVSISPSTVNFYYQKHIVVNLRVCSVPFFGIYNKDEKICGIIQHTADNLFLCHVLTCPTNAIELCKTLKAACELRYQQCVDSRMFNTHKPSNNSLDESKTRLVGHSDKQIKNEQILHMNIISQMEKVKCGLFRRIYQQKNWVKFNLLPYSSDVSLPDKPKFYDEYNKETTDFHHLL
ncbi:unnamed protein product [Schistosoma intercalatum]|nr:unnamed protein product [Schistosoma intercalatum]